LDGEPTIVARSSELFSYWLQTEMFCSDFQSLHIPGHHPRSRSRPAALRDLGGAIPLTRGLSGCLIQQFLKEQAMNAQLLAVIVSAFAVVVSALAVLVSAVMQNRTLRTMRINTLASINASNRKDWIADLQKILSEYLNTAYQVKLFYREAMIQQKVWPGNHWDLVNTEDRLFNGICLRINLNRYTHKNFYSELEVLRGLESTADWIERRGAVVETARTMFDSEWQDIIAGGSDGRA
jgi:hypothetical protein